MPRYFLKLAYNGRAYHGWQVQPNAVSIQEILEDALSKLLQPPISLVGCGRTDSGVHAYVFYAHFETDAIFDPKSLINKLNSFLSEDIAIYDCFPVSEELHARFSAVYRTYRYFITTQKNPFLSRYAHHIFRIINFEKMNESAKLLYDYIDFSSFSKAHTQTMTNNCIITKAFWFQYKEGTWCFEITADRFLRNMVRAIVGTLLEVGYEKLSLDDFRNIIESKNREKAGISVPAHALFLYNVGYPENLLKGSLL